MKKIFFIGLIFIFFCFSLFSYEEEGIASWYGPDFHGKKTSNGEIFNTNDFTAAHRTLPFGTIVKVVSLENNKEITVRINDRGPFAKDRIIDLSHAAANEIGALKDGTMHVKLVVLEEGTNTFYRCKKYQTYTIQLASYSKEYRALRLLERLKNKGIMARIIKVDLPKTLYRINIPELKESELQLVKEKLHKEGFDKYLVKKDI